MTCDTFDFHTWEDVDPDAFGTFATYANAAPIQNIARLADGRFIVAYRVNSPSDRHEVKVVDFTGGTYATGPITVVPGISLLGIAPVVVALDATHFVLVYRDFSIAGTVGGGDSITLGGSTPLFGSYAAIRATGATAISSNTYVAYAFVDTVAGSETGSDWEVHARICTVSGTTITPGLDFAISTGMASNDCDLLYGVPYANSSGIWALALSLEVLDGVSTGNKTAYMAIGNTSGSFDLQPVSNSLTQISIYVQLKWLDDTHLVAYYSEDNGASGEDNALLMRVATISGATIFSLGAVQTIAASTANPSYTTGIYFYGVDQNGMAALSATEIIVHYSYDNYDTGTSCYRVAYLAVSGDTISEVAHCDINAGSDYIIYSREGRVLSGGYPAVAEYTPSAVIICEPSTEVLLLGLSAVSNTAYVTAWADGAIVLNIIDLALNTQIDSIALCTATLAQVLAKTLVAYPVGLSDTEAYIYGRIDTTAGIAHVLHTTDTGLSFELIETAWGTDYAGSMLVFGSGDFMALRCNALSSKLYQTDGTGALGLKSTLPFAGPVEPHGVRYSFWDDAIIAAVKAAGEAQTVVYTYPPYLAWTDITTNHPQTAVNALAPL